MGRVPGSSHGVTEVGSSTWLAWAALALGVVALVFTNAQIKRNRRLAARKQARPHVGMLMEPHAADWHVIELVVAIWAGPRLTICSFRFRLRRP